jgi:acyl-CoA thioesterase-1
VLIGLQYSPAVERNERHKAIGRVINEVAAAENVLLVRRYDAMQFLANSKWENLLSNDGLHQNDLGYRCMAEHVARAVVMNAFPPRVGGSKDASKLDQVGRAEAPR